MLIVDRTFTVHRGVNENINYKPIMNIKNCWTVSIHQLAKYYSTATTERLCCK